MATAYLAPQGRQLGAFLDRRPIGAVKVRRWDGVEKTFGEWDCLRKDPELWSNEGNCLVHLYERGNSRRGPSFRVPFAALIDAQCFPLIARFISTDGQRPRTPRDIRRLERADSTQPIELYIAPGPMSNKEQTLQYHLATRNLFAWIFRQPLVGVHLGQALVALLNSMHEFRSGMGDNLADMLDYLEEAGYLDITGSPDHALALAYFAEHFQLRDLYVRAMAHCVGMNERLHTSSEYLYLEQRTKKLVRSLRGEMENRLFKASDTLRNFLDDELSEAYIGLSAGSRAHLERFRSFLMAHYTTQLGYYPPRIFDSNLFRMMREDFEALYELLVDNGYDSSAAIPSIAIGGICTLQLVQDFDGAHRHVSLEHPLPLLPFVATEQKSRRMSLLPRGGRTKPDQKLLEHAALIKATNWKREVFTNDLVSAYRQFEEELVMTSSKADKLEKVSLVDARKVRWLLVYAAFQVLRTVTEEPVEVQEDLDASYHLSISTDLLPIWDQKHELGFLIRSQAETVRASMLIEPDEEPQMLEAEVEQKIEIKPDIDYFALARKSLMNQVQDGLLPEPMAGGSQLTRSSSFSRAISLTKRRSLMFLKSAAGAFPVPTPPSLRSAHHEIVVHGYGNGTNEVQLDDHRSVAWASRSDSSDSNATSTEDSVFDRTDGTDDDTETDTMTSIKSPTGTTFTEADHTWDPVPAPLNVPAKRRDVVSMIMPSAPAIPERRTSLRRPMSAMLDMHTFKSSEDVKSQPSSTASSPILARSNSFLQRTASMRLPDLRRRSFALGSTRRISESSVDLGRLANDDKAEWAALQSWLDGDRGRLEVSGRNGKGDFWAQYAELGGLTETR